MSIIDYLTIKVDFDINSVSYTVPQNLSPKKMIAIRRFTTKTAEPIHSAYSHALSLLRLEQSNLESRIKHSTCPIEKKALRIALGWTIPENHVAFQENKCTYSYFIRVYQPAMEEDVKKDMYAIRYKSKVLPLLLKNAHKQNVIGDMIPDHIPHTCLVQLNYPRTNWLGLAGHSIEPQNATTPPTITLDRVDGKSGLVSVLIIDLDKVDVVNGVREQWCNYYLANIELGDQSVILNGTESMGDIVYDYVPLLTPHSTPKKAHRFAVVVLSQETKIDVEAVKKEFKILAIEKTEKALESKSVVFRAAEEKIGLFERASFLPLFKYAESSKMQIMSYGFLTSTYNLHTPFIYKSLGLHEPVYGVLPRGNPSRYLERMKTSERTLQQAIKPNEEMDGHQIQKLFNDAIRIDYPIPLAKEKFSSGRLLNNVFDVMNQGKELETIERREGVFERVEKVIKKKNDAAIKALLKKQSKLGDPKKDILKETEAKRMQWRSRDGRMPQVTSFTAVALSKLNDSHTEGQ